MYAFNRWSFERSYPKRIVDSIDWNIILKVLEEHYEGKIDKPVYITVDKKLKRSAGYHRCTHRRVNKQAEELIMDHRASGKNASWLHHIKINGQLFNINFSSRYSISWLPWNLKEHYSKKEIEENYFLCYLFHLLAHEMQHSVQYDFLDSNFPHSNIEKERVLNLEYKHDFKYSDFADTYYHTAQEADAEKGAQINGPKLLKKYLERTQRI